MHGHSPRRIQAVVDRRFNRRKYNAAKTVKAFSARLRDEIDLDALAAEVLAVVDQTMQLTPASLWLQESALEPRVIRCVRPWRPCRLCGSPIRL